MWLIYLRFSSKAVFARANSREEKNKILEAAKTTKDPVLKEYATFYSSRTIRSMEWPDLPKELLISPRAFSETKE